VAKKKGVTVADLAIERANLERKQKEEEKAREEAIIRAEQ